jgi:DNA replication and repair protein RecF
MQLTHLSLTNFRNFRRLEIDIPNGATLLVGANAQGKTSLLEAIYYLTSANSPHTTNDRQLINFLSLRETPPFARLVAEVQRAGRLHRIEIRIILDSMGPTNEVRLRKEILVNGIKKRVHDLAGGFNAVLFLPQDMRVIEGSPGERRRHLNASISQAEPEYAHSLAKYGKVLSQRNALLKQLQERSSGSEQLAFWDQQLAELAATLMRTRAVAIHEIEKYAIQIHKSLSRGSEVLRLDYKPAYQPKGNSQGQLGLPLDTRTDWENSSRQNVLNGFLEGFQNSRKEEIARGTTLIGPHRDDLEFLVNGINLRLYGSRGQNRTAMLAIKLAEIEWLHHRTGDWPVLLLDEVLAELDPNRRDDLLERVGNVNQAVLTASDISMFSSTFKNEATIWKIISGTTHPL